MRASCVSCLASATTAILWVTLVPLAVAVPSDADDLARVARQARAQALVDDLRSRLSIANPVMVSVVPDDALAVSVRRAPDRPEIFSLSIADDFLRSLSPEELGAAMAHELGHVWIFTHHPYLQTEELANEVALRVVTRDSLEALYTKVWTGRERGDLTYLPTEAPEAREAARRD